ncbi:MAG: PEP-utilizing enzyme [Patescibacteria group bacterium]
MSKVSYNHLGKEDIVLTDWEFEFQQRDTHPILMADLWCESLVMRLASEIQLPVENYDYLFTSSSRGYVRIRQKDLVISKMQKAISDEKYLSYIADTTMLRTKELTKVTDGVMAVFSGSDSKENLALLWKKTHKALLDVIPWYFIPYYVTEGNMITDKIKEGLKKHQKSIEEITDSQNALMVLIFPTEEVLLQKAERDLATLVDLAEKTPDFERNKSFMEKVEAYRAEYSWTKSYVVLPKEPLSIEEVFGRIHSGVEKKFAEQYRIQHAQKEKNKELASKLLERIAEDKELVNQVMWARRYGWLLSASVEESLVATARLIPFYKKIAETIGVSYEHWIHCTAEEISSSLESGEKISPAIITERIKGYVFFREGSGIKLAVGETGAQLAGWIDGTVGVPQEEICELKGQPASPGFVTGKVRVATTPQEAYNILEGEILVCSMTSPDYLPAMKRAGAIVTDEGGLLSHAAIVSREIGKPAVIATKIATRVLKTGDLVEVDANKGIIRIINK